MIAQDNNILAFLLNFIINLHNLKIGLRLPTNTYDTPDLLQELGTFLNFLIFLHAISPSHYDLYLRYSQLARSIYAEYTDLIESLGLNEVWLDMTGSREL